MERDPNIRKTSLEILARRVREGTLTQQEADDKIAAMDRGECVVLDLDIDEGGVVEGTLWPIRSEK